MRFRLAIPFVSAALLVVAACGKKQQVNVAAPERAEGIKIERIAPASIDDYYEAVGTVRAAVSSVLSARTMGSVIALHVHEGDRVKAGQLLVEIDSREAAAQLQKAQAGQREAEQALEEVERSIRGAESAKAAADAQKQLAASTFARYKSLLDRHSVSPQEFDEVQARNRVAEAEAERAERMLQTLAARRTQVLARIDQAKADSAAAQVYTSYSRVVSPFNGVVTAKQTDIGQTATPGAPLLTVEDDSRFRLEVAVEESRVSTARRGETVPVLIDALGDSTFEGKVDEIVPASDSASRSFTLKISLPAEATKRGAKSGMYGKARFSADSRQAILVPAEAITRRGQLVGVYVVDKQGFARLRLITAGKSYNNRVEVLSGLSEGERIVSDASGKISDGVKVE
jgi:multidrug efflux pump subunit AcrA (membrane-fusion protein)